MIRRVRQTVLLSALGALVVQAQAPVITGFTGNLVIHPDPAVVPAVLNGNGFWPSGPNDPTRCHIYLRQEGGTWTERGVGQISGSNTSLTISFPSQPYLATPGRLDVKMTVDGKESNVFTIQVRRETPTLDSVSPDQILLKPGINDAAFQVGLRGRFWVSPIGWFINGKFYANCFQHPDYGDEVITWPRELRAAGLYSVQLKNALGASETRLVELVGAPVLTGSIPAVIRPSDLAPKATPPPGKAQVLNTAQVPIAQLRPQTFEIKATFQGSAPITISWQTDQAAWQDVPVKGAIKGSEVHLNLPVTILTPAAWLELRLVNKAGESKLRIPRGPNPMAVAPHVGSPLAVTFRTPQGPPLVALTIPPLPPAANQRFDSVMPRLQPSVRSWIQDQAQRQRGLPAPDLEAIRTAARTRFAPPPPVHAAPVNSFATPRAASSKPTMAAPPTHVATPLPSTTLSSVDIEALVFIVLMQSSKSAQEDLKTIMDGVKAINKQKEGLRQLTNEVKQKRAGSPRNDTPCASPDCKALEGRLRTLGAQLPPKARLTLPPIATMGDLAGVEAKLKDSLDSLSEMGETESLRLQMAMDRVSKFMTALSNIEKKSSDTSDAIIANLK